MREIRKTTLLFGLPVSRGAFPSTCFDFYAFDRLRPLAIDVTFLRHKDKKTRTVTVWGVQSLPSRFVEEFNRELGKILNVCNHGDPGKYCDFWRVVSRPAVDVCRGIEKGEPKESDFFEK